MNEKIRIDRIKCAIEETGVTPGIYYTARTQLAQLLLIIRRQRKEIKGLLDTVEMHSAALRDARKETDYWRGIQGRRPDEDAS
jgi:hypothetical protein